MTVVDLARTFRLLVGVDTEQERRHIFKRCTGLTCIEQAHIELQVIAIIDRHSRIVRWRVGDPVLSRGHAKSLQVGPYY